MTKDENKAYMKAWREAHKEQQKAYMKAWYEAHKEQTKAWYEAHKEQQKAWYEAHKEQRKAYRQAHKEQAKAYMKAWYEANKDQAKAYMKAYMKAYLKSDVNSLGQTKTSIRQKSQRYLKKYGTKIPDYEIHHCCTYDDPSKFIYISRSLHLKIHQYLRDNNIDADSDHYEQIKHLLDDSVVMFNI